MDTRSCWRFGLFLLCVVAQLGRSTAALGQITDLSITSAPCPHLDGFVVNQLRIDFEGQLFEQQLQVALDSGSIFQDSMGDSFLPSSLLISVFPSLACDSFIGIGDSVPFPSFPSLPFWPADSLDVLIAQNDVTESTWDVAWAPAPGIVIDSGEDFFIAQVTLSEDAEGDWSYSGNAGGQPFQIARASISGGVMRLIPEPTSVSMLALSALSASTGRRRRA